ncbi:RagB/SusD family nutrient uptake outer membrane protein [Prolixibacteraceae bacterium Z1-6]|uniref:RagB/SusD family nutrient uptake outer membrane protein n=1 Tax=Draconibacterium aestuarii TaxID=2998507 RepID=A0A9X3F700_9BACT|nr:RagB/SusD family nutrient uptake outer membrane protein [Prolixibacteraceae bacterium Z1-6]
MKKIIYSISLILVTGFLFYSCDEEEFLNELPISELSTGDFFETSAQFEQAVNAAYTNLGALAGNQSIGVGDGTFWAMGEMRSDNTTFQDNLTDQSGHRYWHLDQFIMNAQNEIVSIAWNQCYEGIGKCNIVMQYSEEAEYENKSRYIAEVKYLRALYYFTLVRHFGDVPLITAPAGSYNEAFEGNKRVSTELVYDQIVADLNDAKQNLPKSYSGKNVGRATEGAARTLLGKVLMWRDQYSEAATELEAVVNSKEYDILDDYASVFDLNNENNEEIVFSIQFIEGTYGLGSANMYRFTPWNAGTTYLPQPQILARTGMNIPTSDLINSFEEGDERLSMIDFSWVDEEFGIYNGNIVPFTRKFWDPNHAVQYVAGSDFPLFRYPHVLLMLAECYLRDGGGDPAPLVNQVRERAGLDPLSTVTIDDVIHERRVEFHCEADRWDVLVRTGKAVEVMTAHGAEERQNRPNTIRGQAYNKINILFPIPSSVLENDPTMEQNSEYK